MRRLTSGALVLSFTLCSSTGASASPVLYGMLVGMVGGFRLVTVNTSMGAISVIGTLTPTAIREGNYGAAIRGVAFALDGTLYMVGGA